MRERHQRTPNDVPALADLTEVIAGLKTREAVADFLADLCTPAERQAMQERWIVAQLVERAMPYRQISENTGTSTATITRVARALAEGVGYKKALAKLRKKSDDDPKDRRPKIRAALR